MMNEITKKNGIMQETHSTPDQIIKDLYHIFYNIFFFNFYLFFKKVTTHQK